MDGFLATSDEEFEWALQMNFFTLRATRAALGPMLEQGSGSIVNIASVNSFYQPDAATIDYGVATAAVVNLSKSPLWERRHKAIMGTLGLCRVGPRCTALLVRLARGGTHKPEPGAP